MKTRFMLLLAIAISLSVKAANPTCGLTIITHGFQSPSIVGGGSDPFPEWERAMARAITNRIGASVPIYRVWFNPINSQVTLLDGATSIDIGQAGGAIIMLDWSDVSYVTTITAQSVADQFFNYLFGQMHNGRSLVEIPIHMIGHSRGCSINARLAYFLAGNGVLVEQVTTLDPHPVRPWHLPPGADWIPETYINVIFADNYYQTDSFPEGMPIAGTAFQDLSPVLSNQLPGDEHQHVHTYYHGTIDLSATSVDGDSIVSAWYQNTLSRDVTGYNFSRFKNPLLPRPPSGINQFISGAGGTGSRVSVDSPQQLWSNAGFDQRSVIPSVVTVGQMVDIPYYFADRNSAQTITFYTDADTNPFNGFRSQIGSANQNSRPAGSIGTGIFQWTPTTADVGTHFIRIKGANANNARFDYYLKPVTVQATPTAAPSISSVSPATLPPSSSPQLLTILGSNFKGPGDPNPSTLVFYDPAGNPYPRTPDYINSGELRYNIIVQSATGTWKVKVVNGAVESLPYSFTVSSGTVQLTGLSITGPGTVNENTTSGQFTAKAVFSDGTTPTVNASWSVISGPASSSSSGLLSAGSVSANTTVTVSASYSTGGITKTASANVTIVNSGGGGTQTQELVVNGGYESGTAGWSRNGNSGIVTLSYPHNGSGYAYLGNVDDAIGSVHQFITIPGNATSVTLTFYLNVKTSELAVGNPPYDQMDVNIRNTSDVLLRKLVTYSEANKGSNVDGNPNYHLKTLDLTDFRGQTVLLQFYCDTDVSKITIFRIDDVSVQAVVSVPVTLTSLAINGPSSVTEGNTAQYFATAIFSDGSTQTVTPNTWGENSSATTISSSGLLTAGQVSADTSVTLYAAHTSSGVTREAYKDVTVVNVAPAFSYLAISGPSSINENSSGQFTATAIFSDGSSQSVSPNWSENSAMTSISSGGLLTAGGVSSDTTVTVSASHTIDGVTRNANQGVLIVNIPAPVTLSALSISGPSSVDENSTATFSATASFSDGSLQVVSPTWSVDSVATSISIFGLLSAGEVASDTPVTVSARYTLGGITRNAQKSVTVINTTVTPTYTITASSGTGGTISPSGSIIKNAGENQAFTASPDANYIVNQWLVDSSPVQNGGNNYTLPNIQAPHRVQVTFTYVPPQYTITASAGAGGSINPSGSIPKNAGDSQAFTASPEANYVVDQWLVDGGVVQLRGTGYTLPNIQAPHSVQVTFTINTPIPGTVIAWGDNTGGQTNIPYNLTNVRAIAGGSYHSLALKTDGTLAAWGFYLSNDGISGLPMFVPAELAAVTEIACGGYHCLALKSDSTVVAWGNNMYNQTNVPAGLSNIVAVAGGGWHSVALRADGAVVAWGWNEQTNVPAGLINVVAIAAGWAHSMALKADGTVVAWGSKGEGETSVPAGLTNVVAIGAGAYYSLALKIDGTVTAWGSNGYGQTNVPEGLNNVVAVAGSAGLHGLALKADGTVVAWGRNDYGQANVPADVSNIVTITGGGFHSLAILGSGAPVITVRPFRRTVILGSAVALSCMAVGEQPLSYQWRLNGANIIGATGASLTIDAAQSSDVGDYSVVVNNRLGSVVSGPYGITVIYPTARLTEMALGNGMFQFVLNVPVGSNYVIQTSSNLVNWLPLSTHTIPAGGAVPIFDAGSINQPRRFYRAVPHVSAEIISPATSGEVSAPFIITNDYIYQVVTTVGLNGGRAAYNFTIATAGNYVIEGMVSALDAGENSFFVNMDAEPEGVSMLWDIPPTSGFQPRTVSWFGNGPPSEFVPKVFNLGPGQHQLIIRGREANTLLQSVTISPYP